MGLLKELILKNRRCRRADTALISFDTLTAVSALSALSAVAALSAVSAVFAALVMLVAGFTYGIVGLTGS